MQENKYLVVKKVGIFRNNWKYYFINNKSNCWIYK